MNGASMSISWEQVTPTHVERALDEFDRLGASAFFAAHGFAPTTTYEMVRGDRVYPPKAILGTAYELATGERLESKDFEGGKSGAVRILSGLGFDIRPKAR